MHPARQARILSHRMWQAHVAVARLAGWEIFPAGTPTPGPCRRWSRSGTMQVLEEGGSRISGTAGVGPGLERCGGFVSGRARGNGDDDRGGATLGPAACVLDRICPRDPPAGMRRELAKCALRCRNPDFVAEDGLTGEDRCWHPVSVVGASCHQHFCRLTGHLLAVSFFGIGSPPPPCRLKNQGLKTAAPPMDPFSQPEARLCRAEGVLRISGGSWAMEHWCWNPTLRWREGWESEYRSIVIFGF